MELTISHCNCKECQIMKKFKLAVKEGRQEDAEKLFQEWSTYTLLWMNKEGV